MPPARRDKTLVISVPSLTDLSARLPPDLANPVVVQLRLARHASLLVCTMQQCPGSPCLACMRLLVKLAGCRAPAYPISPSSSFSAATTSPHPSFPSRTANVRPAKLPVCLPACLVCTRIGAPGSLLQLRLPLHAPPSPGPRPCCRCLAPILLPSCAAGSDGSMSNAASFMSLEELKQMEVG